MDEWVLVCEIHQTELLIMHTDTLSPEPEFVQDLMSIVDGFSSRLDGVRQYRQTVEKALKDEHRAQDPHESHI